MVIQLELPGDETLLLWLILTGCNNQDEKCHVYVYLLLMSLLLGEKKHSSVRL